MKNINIKVLLSVIMCFILTITINVDAAGNATAYEQNSQRISGLTFYEEGEMTPEGTEVFYHPVVIDINGQRYDAYCPDPGFHIARGYRPYTCTPFNEDPGLVWLLSQNVDRATLSFAVRFYAVMSKTVQVGDIYNADDAPTEAKAAYIRYVQAMDEAKSNLPEEDKTITNSFGTADKYFRGNDAFINTAYSLAESAHNMSNLLDEQGATLTFRTAAINGQNVTYTITSTQSIPREDIEFTCEGANCAIIEESWGGTTGSITVSVECEENYEIKAKFTNVENSNVYICTPHSGDSQFLYFHTSDEVDDSIIHPGTPVWCVGECCPEDPIEPGYIDGSINNCCTDGAVSEAHEYDLDQLFCNNEELGVAHYDPKCGATLYIDNETGLNSKYCRMYCTERVMVEVPGAITATSGRYFTLTTTSQGTKSPYIEGYRRCRIRVDFEEWENDYGEKVDTQVEQYNAFQYNEAYRLLYEKAKEDKYTRNETLVIECEIDEQYTYTIRNCTPSAANNNCTGSQHLYHRLDTADCDLSYTVYRFMPAYHKDYFFVALDAQLRSDYKAYKLLQDGGGRTEHDLLTAEETELKPLLEQCDNLINGYRNQTHTFRVNGNSVTRNYSCERDTSDFENKQEAVLETYASYESKAMNAEEAYNVAAFDAIELEKTLDMCDNYFTTAKHHAAETAEYRGMDPNANFQFDASVGFYYTQIYLNDEADLVLDKQSVRFSDQPGCEITGPIPGPDGEDKLADKRYSTNVYSLHTNMIDLQDFREADLVHQERANGFESYRDELYIADKLFTHDAKYKAVCSWDEGENRYMTLVPNGAASESTSTINYTEHGQEYRAYLTTFDGTYETHWAIGGLGTHGKFDQFFRENGTNTCGGLTPTESSVLTCKLHVEYEVVLTGYCNGSNGTDTTVDPDDCDPYKEAMELFNFRVVDPANIFPGGTEQDGKTFAYNWTHGPNGPETLNEIQNRAERDETYAPANKTYSFTLTPSDMRHIKNYNESRLSAGGYSDFRLVCSCGTACTQCKSEFINELSRGYVKYNSANHAVSGWTGSKSLEQVRSSVIGG